MRFTYSIEEKDYLDYLLFSASRSAKVRKRRALNKLILLVIYVVTGLFLWSRNGPVASAIFYVLCLPLYFLYGRMEKKQYIRHFRRFINDHFRENIGKNFSIELEENNFHVIDDEDNWYGYEDIESVSETGNLFILQLKNGIALVLPKNKINGEGTFAYKLKEIIESRKIKTYRELEWKWK